MKKEIARIARNARKWSERYVVKHTNDFYLDLGCFCAIASSYLSTKLHTANIKHEIALYKGCSLSHCFIKIDDYIVDITATQFNLSLLDKTFKSVEIITQEDIEKRQKSIDEKYSNTPFYFWEINQSFSNHNELLDYQKENYWPIEQRIDGHSKLAKYFS